MIELNKIYHGDSYELIKKIPDKSIDLIYVDVPYLYNVIGVGGNSNNSLSKRIVKKNKELEEADITSGFKMSILDEFVRVMKRINIVIWVSKMQLASVYNYFMNETGKEVFSNL